MHNDEIQRKSITMFVGVKSEKLLGIEIKL